MRDNLHFDPSARLQFILSEELVSDPNVAVLEFVKNGYDAGAKSVSIDFELNDSGPTRLLIWDDGHGMDRNSFETNWMHPGFSVKARQTGSPGSRVPVGEKGLGRLAAGRLGENLDVYTRRSSKAKWLHARFVWDEFDDMDKLLSEIPIEIDDETEPPVNGLASGTVIEVTSLKQRWNSRLPGRRAKNRSTTRLGRLRQDLELLLLPILANDADFEVELCHDSDLHEDESGPVVSPSFELLDYEFEFSVAKTKKSWVLQRTIRRSPQIAELTDSELTTTLKLNADDLAVDVDLDQLGPLTGTFFYAPHSAKKLREIGAPAGVRVYRDGVRVDPYGDEGDDWLGAKAKKAVRQGHAAIQPNALYGAVRISRSSNPNLRALANREGLIENAAREAFEVLSRNEFVWFAEVIQTELLDPEWERNQAKKKSDAASSSSEWAIAITRTAAHSVRQPLSTAGTELGRLRNAIRRSEDIPDDLQKRLVSLEEKTRQHLSRADEALERMLGMLDVSPEYVPTNIPSLIEDVIDRTAPDAASAAVAVIDNTDGILGDIELPAGVIEHALEELLENAIRAPRPSGRAGEVYVHVKSEDDAITIVVEDNAGGIDETIRAKLFDSAVSTSGRIGLGLAWNKKLLQIVRGDLELKKTDSEGSIFEMRLPHEH